MKTPEEIFDKIHRNAIGKPGNIKTVAIEAMKEFGRQAWIEGRYGEDKYAEGAKLVPYDEWVQNLYLNQIAKDAQERGEYENDKQQGNGNV